MAKVKQTTVQDATVPSRRVTKRIKTKPHPDAKCCFTQLPPELRNQVYDLVLTNNPSSHITIDKAGKNRFEAWREPALLAVCKQVRTEASPIYYGTNTFEVYTELAEFDSLTVWLTALVQRCGTKPFLRLRIQVYGRIWHKLRHLFPLLNAIRQTGLNLQKTPQMVYGSERKDEVVMSIFSRTGLDRHIIPVLTEAHDLGIRAFQEGWTEEWLEMEFLEWTAAKAQMPSAKAREALLRKQGRKEKRQLTLLATNEQ